ncbi:transcription-repair coupling factor [Candidatus Marinamargulisbacteria bacterium SCGC AG-343-K17]|nr:transcription-repair coupling factor [Candidatus Marinamargulisbacteria bacterium SCGC AG-343-K17]
MSTKNLAISLSSEFDRDQLIESLNHFGYERASMVIEQGVYSVKGAIVDVFPANQNQPLRFDFFSGQLDRLTSFRPDTQRSIRDLTETVIAPFDSELVKRFSFDNRVLDSEVVSNIQEGDHVVHERYGVGIYQGFTRLSVGNQEGEYVLIQFKGADKLYMPLDQIPLLHRYTGVESSPKLNGLYDGGWERTRRNAHRALKVLAEEIFTMFKMRQTVQGYAYSPDTDDQLAFEVAFPFDETPDQRQAIEDVKKDMESQRPMDRLVCGDVGYGKTEVMIRAAVKAALNLKQVMVLVPTTILSEQHYNTFLTRCEGMNISIGVMSRLKSPTHNRKVLAGLINHHLDIVIGTHRLLSKDVAFKDLGLVIVDEEQRFGVQHKEKIKAMSKDIDILTTSATPIPRTLYMSLTGAKAISSLNTPPPGRVPIQTVIGEYSTDIIQSAIKKEIDRGGQVYFLHNHIDQLAMMSSEITRLVSGVRVRIAHGQMKPKELEDVMVSFYHHEFDVLLCTTIIENGLDIQNANTIIINRSDRLGLSQIHQIRGRVGRCSIQAYAYILFPMEHQLTDESKGRLQALKEAVGLGVGYQLAMKDLEIRGAGTLLGERQSGHLTSIGFDLYCKLLEKNLKKVRGQTVENDVLISLKDVPNVFIPDSYIDDSKQRLAMYQRFLTVKNRIGLKKLKLECEDRFGPSPKRMTEFIASIDRQLNI